MANIKTYTDIEQSKKLAEILPIESADMCYPPYYIGDEDGDHLYYSLPLLEHKDKCAHNKENKDEYIPCWSLAALLNLMLYPKLEEYIADSWDLTTFTDETLRTPIEIQDYKNPVDACVAMIEKLHELNLL